MRSTVDDYSDLPDWIRPGARVARLDHSRASMLTVTKITKTQIVTLEANGLGIRRFDRTPVAPDYHELRNNPDAPHTYRERGSYSACLVTRDDPRVVQILREHKIRVATSTAISVAENARIRWNNPTNDEKKLDLDVRAMLVFDEVDEAIAKARRRIQRAMVDLPTAVEDKS
jgi:hypothetical protein